jgi:hypothetical protein
MKSVLGLVLLAWSVLLAGCVVGPLVSIVPGGKTSFRTYTPRTAQAAALLQERLGQFPELKAHVQVNRNGPRLVLITNRPGSPEFKQLCEEVERKLGPALLRQVSVHRETDFLTP